MSWNYRLTRTTVEGEEAWGIREIYYDEAGEVMHWTEDTVAAHGETREELADDMNRMAQALAMPAFDVDTKTWITP